MAMNSNNIGLGRDVAAFQRDIESLYATNPATTQKTLEKMGQATKDFKKMLKNYDNKQDVNVAADLRKTQSDSALIFNSNMNAKQFK